ncbi:type VII secretion target [Mycolicibacterium septicum]|nr:type VII secretion target [Mycolicibacterium septicum]
MNITLLRGDEMPSSNEPLKVTPAELQSAADKLDGHGSDFVTAHQAAHERAGQVRLGSGLASGALPGMLTAWETDVTRFGKQFAGHAEDYRVAATGYADTDADGAAGIDDAGSAL